MERLEEAAASLDRRIGRLRDDLAFPWLPYAGWFVAGASVGVLVMAMRRRDEDRDLSWARELDLLGREDADPGVRGSRQGASSREPTSVRGASGTASGL